MPEKVLDQRSDADRDKSDSKAQDLEKAIAEADDELQNVPGGPDVKQAQERLSAARLAGDTVELMAARNSVADALLVEWHRDQTHRGRATGFDEGDAYLLRAPGDTEVHTAQSQLRQALHQGSPADIDVAREQVYTAMANEVESATRNPTDQNPSSAVEPVGPDQEKYGMSKRDPGLFRHPGRFGNPTGSIQRKHNELYQAALAEEKSKKNWGDPAVDQEGEQWRRGTEARLRSDPETDPKVLEADGARVVADAAAFVPPVRNPDSEAKRQYDRAVANVQQESPNAGDSPEELKPALPDEAYPPSIRSTAEKLRYGQTRSNGGAEQIQDDAAIRVQKQTAELNPNRRSWESLRGKHGKRYLVAPNEVRATTPDDQIRAQSVFDGEWGDKAQTAPVAQPSGGGHTPAVSESQDVHRRDERPDDIVPGMHHPDTPEASPGLLGRLRQVFSGRRRSR